MKHLEGVLRVVLDDLFVERHNVVVAYSKTRGVEVELGLFLRRNADAYLHRHFWILQRLVEHRHLVLVVDDGNDVVEAVLVQLRYVVDILLALESVAYYEDVLVYQSAVVELLYEVDVECT